MQLGAVYFLEYVASTGAASLANPRDSDDWLVENAYAILAFCYQVRRCSLSLSCSTPMVC